MTAFKIFDYIERSHFLKKLDDLYDKTAELITEFWTMWNSKETSILGIFNKGKEIVHSISKLKWMTKAVEEDSLYVLADISRYHLRI